MTVGFRWGRKLPIIRETGRGGGGGGHRGDVELLEVGTQGSQGRRENH